MIVLHHELEEHHHLVEAPLVLCEGCMVKRACSTWWWPDMTLPLLTCLGVAHIAQQQGLLQPLLVHQDVAQWVFVVEFLDVTC